MVLDAEAVSYIFVKLMARNTKRETPEVADDDLDAFIMVRVKRTTKDRVSALARSSGIKPATWVRLRILEGLKSRGRGGD